MTRRHHAETRALLAQAFRQAGGGTGPVPVELAAGVVHYLAPRSRRQAEAITAAWWPGWTPETLAGLLAEGKAAAIAAHYHAPDERRTRAAEVARALGIGRDSAGQALRRGQTALCAWLASRAGSVNVQK